jgi:hypothetical protein
MTQAELSQTINLGGLMAHVEAVLQRFNTEVVAAGLAGKVDNATVTALTSRVADIEAIIGDASTPDSDSVINKVREMIAFFANVSESDTLASTLSDLNAAISALGTAVRSEHVFVATLSSAPTSSTLSYTTGSGQDAVTRQFKVGDEVRIYDQENGKEETNGFVYYKLYDLVTENNVTTAYWELIGAGKTGELIHPATNVTGTAAVTTSPYYASIWEGTCDGITSLYTGLMVTVKVPVAGHKTYGVVLNVNNLGEHPVVMNVDTNVSTRYAEGCMITLIYDAEQTANVYQNGDEPTTVQGCWKIADYDSNSDVYMRIYKQITNNSTWNKDYPLLAGRSLSSAIAETDAKYTTMYGLIGSNSVTPTVNPITGYVKVKGLYLDSVKIESKTASNNGTDLSLVTTGEKATWNTKYSKPSEGIPTTDLAFTPATLTNGKIPESQLPSYVDDVIEGYYKSADGKFYESKSGSTYSTEITGEAGKIYIDLDTNKTYRWGGSSFGLVGSTGTIDAAAGANIGSVGTPSVSASTSGDTTTFTFDYLKGAKGDNGTSAAWFSGTVVSGTNASGISATVSGSKAGDMYLNTGTSNVYKATAANTWGYVCNIKGATGSNGTNGTNGTSAYWFSGTAVTGTGTGISQSVTNSKAGDMYLNTSTYNVYTATAANTWNYLCNIKGTAGTNATTTSVFSASANGLAPAASSGNKTTAESSVGNYYLCADGKYRQLPATAFSGSIVSPTYDSTNHSIVFPNGSGATYNSTTHSIVF